MPPKRKELSAFARALLDDEAKDTGTLAAELDEACADGDYDKEMVSHQLLLISWIDCRVTFPYI
mgnify:CR=1 FL=1